MKHRDNGEHHTSREASWIVGRFWAERDAARRAARQTVWDKHRPIPLGVLDTWPAAVTA